ncbi:type II CRISPR RNA-guided endonuclease Cas9 [Macrococcus capreoli]|uniref:type II CRISPR RNA-guided endonuclease Cas9 n=1 Tax=Macrococcus capreoli TaxID=2982690 RepID=UPI003EE665AC
MANYILGLDIGIASVGYGLINSETKEIIDAGVRLFNEAKVENNEGRRSKRGTRRLKRRRKFRLQNIKHLLSNYGFIDDEIPTSTNLYEIRVRGLTEELSKEEFVIALLHLGKRRGIHNIEVSDESDSSEDSLSTKEQLKRNEKALKEKYVCELQLERFNENNVRGPQNRFKTTGFVREAKKLLETQSKFHAIDQDFIEEYIHLLEKRRAYYEGPGHGSPFGWEQDLKKWYETLMGRCTYYPEELRSVKYAYTADLFNVLNDLNNLTITRDEEDKLNKGEKFQLIENVFKKKKSVTLKHIAKEIGVSDVDIKGYRINKSGTPEFTKFKIYHDIKGITSKEEVLENPEILDGIAEILTIYQSPQDIIENINKLNINLSSDEINNISELTGYNGTHSLSLKCIKLVLDELWESSDNQMSIFAKLNLKPKKIDLEKQNKIPTELIEDFILSPVVKRSFIQSVKVTNAIIKRYGLPDEIIIELARDTNSADKKKTIQALQKNREATNKRIEEIIASFGKIKAKGLVEKIKLHDMQEGKCLYSLTDIPLEDLLRNPTHYEVDHIIPRSVSFDNSYNNKVLVKSIENSNKSNMTPFQYMNSGKSSISYDEFKQHVLNLSKSKDRISKKKREYLLEERDINKFDVQKEFINRNLVDTRYATRELMSLLKAYFSANELPVKVKSINGGFTSFLRNRWNFSKDRNQGYKHHAEDALIIANCDFLFKQHKQLSQQNEILTKPVLAEEKMNDILTEDQFDEIFVVPRQMQDIKDFRDYKFSHRVDKKPNRQLYKQETIYGTRMINGKKRIEKRIIQNINNIYAKDNDKVKTIFNKSPQKLLIFQKDKKTFEKLEIIMKQYSNEKNPLHKYYEETGNYLTKYSKNDDGPIVKRIRYYGDEAKTYKDLTKNYPEAKNEVVHIKLIPYRFDVFNDDGIYKFITIRYFELKDCDSYFRIEDELYSQKKEDKKISKNAQFIASFYRNDLIKFNNDIFRVIGVNDDAKNKLQFEMVDILTKDYFELQNISKTPVIYKTVNKDVDLIEKFSTDILGNLYKIKSKKHPQTIIKKA